MGSKKKFGAAEVAGIGIGFGAGVINSSIQNAKAVTLADQRADNTVIARILGDEDVEKTKVLLESFAKFKEAKRKKEAREKKERSEKRLAAMVSFAGGVAEFLGSISARMEQKKLEEEARKKALREKRFGWLKRLFRIA